MKLRVRFAIWVSLLLLAVLVGFGGFVYAAVANWLSTSVDNSLRLSAAQVIETIDVERGRIDLSDNPVVQDSRLADELRARGVSIQILETDGTAIKSVGPYQNLPLDPGAQRSALEGSPTLATRADLADGSVRVFTQAMLDQGDPIGIVQISESLTDTEDALRGLATSLLIGSPMLVVAAGLGGYILAGRALAPIDQITTTANRISAEDLSGRLHLPQSADEVGRLAATFDRMLGRLENAFIRERRFTSDAAHQLRTPLAAMQTIIGVTTQRRRTPAEYEAALADLAEETAQLGALTDDLLRLARAEQAVATTDTVNLGTLLTDLADSLRPLADAKGLSLRCEAERNLMVRGDADGLIRLFVNLLDNAIKYTDHGSVQVSARSVDEQVVCVVTDTGPGIGATDLPSVFERFYRGEGATGTPGTGLGLAIAQEIARAHAGTLEAASSAGTGSRFTVRLPRAPATAQQDALPKD